MGTAAGLKQWGSRSVKGLEAAIRKALSGPSGSNPQQRQKIYASARKALKNGLEKEGRGGTDRARMQGRRLDSLIMSIEREFQEKYPQARQPAAAPRRPAPDPAPARQADPSRLDAVAPDRGISPGLDPVMADVRPGGGRPQAQQRPQTMRGQPQQQRRPQAPQQRPQQAPHPQSQRPHPQQRGQPQQQARRRPQQGLEATPLSNHIDPDFAPGQRQAPQRGRQSAPKKKRRWPIFSMILVTALVVSFIGIGIIWVMVGGVLKTPIERDTSVPNPPAKITSEDFAGRPSPDGAFSGDWIDVFVPQNISSVSAGSDAQVALVDTDNREALRVVSANAEANGEALFEVGPGILQSLGGQTALVAMTMRSATETPTQIYVRCHLPGNGDWRALPFRCELRTGGRRFQP